MKLKLTAILGIVFFLISLTSCERIINWNLTDLNQPETPENPNTPEPPSENDNPQNPDVPNTPENFEDSDSFTLFENFETGDFSKYSWQSSGVLCEITNDEKLEYYTQYSQGLDHAFTHGKILKLGRYNSNSKKLGSSEIKLSDLQLEEDSVLNFDYKIDLGILPNTNDEDQPYLFVLVDNQEKLRLSSKISTKWLSTSVPLSKGNHSITIKVSAVSRTYYNPPIKNAAYIDNITIVPDQTHAADIYPKGIQQTFVGGDSLTFTGNALFEDGRIRSGRTVTYSVSGGGTIDQNGVFKPSSNDSAAGTYTVTAYVDGKSAENATVKVLPKNYKNLPVTFGGRTYQGYTGELTQKTRTNSSSGTINLQGPSETNIEADGFITIKGTVDSPDFYNYAVVNVKLKDSKYETYYFIQNDFYERIWLRFGPGVYDVNICLLAKFSADLNGEGAPLNWSWYNNGISYTVTNTRTEPSLEDALYLMPSFKCNADDLQITNIANALIAELPQGTSSPESEILRAIHDWEIHYLCYDNDSLEANSRKKQGALDVLAGKTAVCEGYANLFTALERAAGIKGCVTGSDILGHDWNNTYFNNNLFLIDTTWDDRTSTDYESNPNFENYSYFLVTSDAAPSGKSHVASDVAKDTRRSAIPSITCLLTRNAPQGWY